MFGALAEFERDLIRERTQAGLVAALGTPVTSGCGTGYQGSRVHAPNENIRVADYWDAMRCMGAFIEAFAQA